MPRHGVFPKR